MSLNASTVSSKPRKEFAILAAGTYPARLVQVIDMGLQPQSAWEGKDKEPCQEVALTWEFSDEFLKDDEGNDMTDKPRWLSEFMPFHNLKAEKAKSTGRYLALDPEVKNGGHFDKCLGLPANITIVQKPTKNPTRPLKNKVVGATAMRPKDAEKLGPLVNEPKYFDLDRPDISVFMTFPDFIKERIKSNLKFKGSQLEEMLKDVGGGMPEAPKEIPLPPVKVDNPF